MNKHQLEDAMEPIQDVVSELQSYPAYKEYGGVEDECSHLDILCSTWEVPLAEMRDNWKDIPAQMVALIKAMHNVVEHYYNAPDDLRERIAFLEEELSELRDANEREVSS